MKKQLPNRLLSLLLIAAMCVGLVLPAGAVGQSDAQSLVYEQVDNSAVSAVPAGLKAAPEQEEAPEYAANDLVRVSIVLEAPSTLEMACAAGISPESISGNVNAASYREKLEQQQKTMAQTISAQALQGDKLDVVWNLTLAANIISANVPYGKLEEIAEIPGVERVFLETRYEPMAAEKEEPIAPNMSTATAMTGVANAYASGYTGAGSRIAIIDTGIDTDHETLTPEALEYSLAQLAEKNGQSPEDYMASLQLLKPEEIDAVLPQLNVAKRGEFEADALYVNTKIPFGFNYIDANTDVTHDNDSQSSHGSHVAGIAAANAYVPNGDGTFAKALDKVLLQGVAPDAQLLAMKIFGKNGGAYEADYMAAIEDAILLGADVVNLSIGTAVVGYSAVDSIYRDIVATIQNSGVYVSISAGNNGAWPEETKNGYLYSDDVSMASGGSPGTHTFSMSTASVDNVGYTDRYMTVQGEPILYGESANSWFAKTLVEIAGDYEYILIDGFGAEEDFAALADVLPGKIAICSRGGGVNFADKATNAVKYGAAATIVYNNEPNSMFYMSIDLYWDEQPCVSVTQESGNLMRSAATPVKDDSGKTLYYKGKLTIETGYTAVSYDPDYYTMSDFSSWGVPGSLTMKPEITAPGGNIFSIDGKTQGGTSYEVMSGTSMAAPHGAGMAALVAQYIRENGLEEKTGLTARRLSQSLLMSTAVPVREEANQGAYYSILKQGSGLADVGAAVESGSYIFMDADATASADDGKVKVELGDDPDRTGSYRFSFTVNDLTGTSRAFALSAEFFTQALFTEDGVCYMDSRTAPLNTAVTWTVDGKTLTPDASLMELDFDGDGDVDADDGQALLDYATGVRTQLSNMDKADLDDDGDVDSHDSYQFFTRFHAGALTVPANGSAKVTVTVALTDEQKAALNEHYENGAYVEGYVFVEAMTTQEGLVGERHSIPVLGFYGNWSDASMFDVGTCAEFQTGEETRTPYMGDTTANTYGVLYTADPGYIYTYAGNPLMADDVYRPERNAINGENGDKIAKVYYSLIRNAAASRVTITNTDTGEVLRSMELGPVESAYFASNSGVWQNTGYASKLNWTAKGLAEGTHVSFALTMAPEYYVAQDGSVDWDALGKGATLETALVVDNTAPKVDDVALSITNNAITVIASDNQYVAGVALYDKNGSRLLAYAGAKQEIQPGETAIYQVPLDKVYGKQFCLQVMDYAMNTVTYTLKMTLGEPQPLPQCLAFNLDGKYWAGFDASNPGGSALWLEDSTVNWSAAMVDCMLFMGSSKGVLRVLDTRDPYESYLVGDMGAKVTDMAYNKADGQLYGVVGPTSYSASDSTLVRINKYTAELEELGTIGVSTNTLACDAAGTFYCHRYNSGEVYSFTLDTLAEPKLLTTVTDLQARMIQAMEYDHNRHVLYWVTFGMSSMYYGKTTFVEIDPTTGSYTVADQVLQQQLGCLVVPEKNPVNGEWAAPTDEVSQMLLSHSSFSLLQGASEYLKVDVLPWNVSNHSVIWTSSNPEIVTVNEQGMITGVGAGEATVTVTSVVDPDASASCQVTVSAVQTTLEGILQDAAGTPKFFSWDLEHDEQWKEGAQIDTTFISAAYNSDRNVLYAMDSEKNQWAVHEIDMTTGKTQNTVAANAFGAPLWDMAYSTYWSTEEAPRIYGAQEATLLLTADPMDLSTGTAFDMTTTLYERTRGEILLAVANAGYAKYNNRVDSELVYLLDDTGAVWTMYVYEKDGKMDAYFKYYKSNLREIGFRPDTVLDYQYTSMVVGEDGNLYVSYFDGTTNVIYHLAYNASARTYFASRLDDVGDNVWPAALYAAKSNVAADGAEALPTGEMELLSEAVQSGAPAAEGGLNAVDSAVAPASVMADPKDGMISISVTAKDANGKDIASTNGVAALRYDETAMTLRSVQVNGNYQSVKEEDGQVTVGYVSLEGIPAGGAVATFTFERKNSDTGTVTVDHRQTGNQHTNYQETLTCPSAAFQDVDQSKWYHEAIDFVVSRNLMNGMSNDTFQPNGDMTRAQLVTVLYRLAGTPKAAGKAPFADVQAGRFYSDAVVWAFQSGIAKGVTDKRFAPNASVTREQMVTFFARFAALEGRTISAKGDLHEYRDADAVSAYAVQSMTWAVETGLIQGMEQDTLRPRDCATRAQIAQVLLRYCTNF